MEEKIKKIKVLIMDIDGVLTDGRIILSSFGDELKFFDVRDGFGLALWRKAGYKSAIITANESSTVTRRARMLKIDKVYQKAYNKLTVYNKIKKIFKVTDGQICFIGEDLIDLPILKRIGFSCCVANAIEDIKPEVDYVTKKEGGRGAVREIIDLILKTQNMWKEVTRTYQS
ncbi:MAG: HAD hydrolase family protein [Candidatus Omnitrophota bacterium]|nr:MAG: HAD hydrolase family protein [Candidatus Omnitrophota bacterium]